MPCGPNIFSRDALEPLPKVLSIKGRHPRHIEFGPKATHDLAQHRAKLGAAFRRLIRWVQNWLLFLVFACIRRTVTDFAKL